MRVCMHQEAIKALLEAKDKPSVISRKLKVNIRTVQRIAKEMKTKGPMKKNKKTGRPRSVNTRQTRAVIKKRIKRNDELSLNRVAGELKISKTSIKRIVKGNLGLHSYKLRQGQFLTDASKAGRLQKCKKLLQIFKTRRIEDVLWSDEKIFTVEVAHNSQNHRQLLPPDQKNTLKRKIRTRTLFPKGVMVWGGMTANGKTPLVFIDKNVKINAQVYQKEVLEKVVIPWGRKNPSMIFQQDWAPAHGAKSTMSLLKAKLPCHLTKEDWPSNSPDLNPLDFSVWGNLEESLRTKKITTIDKLKKSLTIAWANLDGDYLRRTVASVIPRLEACVKAKGSNFENLL